MNIRWLIRRDMPTVLDIEYRCFQYSWSEEEFIACLRRRNVIGMCCDVDDVLAGYMVYELLPNRLNLLNFAVDLRFQRQGVGRAMVDKLKSKLSGSRRCKILAKVRESNIDALMFFKAQGFIAISILREPYEDTSEDAILMQYRCRSEVPA